MNVSEYHELKREVSKDALKAMLFFFFWLPCGIAALVAFFVFPVPTSIVSGVLAAFLLWKKKYGQR